MHMYVHTLHKREIVPDLRLPRLPNPPLPDDVTGKTKRGAEVTVIMDTIHFL